LEGPVVDGLVQEVKAAGAGLAILTTHGRGPLARVWLGSVADELVRRLHIPLLLVRPHDGALDLAREPVFERVLIPLDGSPLAERILESAVAVAKLQESACTLLRVIKPMVVGNYDPRDTALSGIDGRVVSKLRTLHDQDRVNAHDYLEAVACRLRAQGLRVRTRIVVHDQPAVAILDEVKAKPGDLVALATHGRGGLQRLLLGSVADKVLRGAGVPVLVFRPQSEEEAGHGPRD
jgi:nucleotide-binding universal stress UspA family protein